MEETYQNIGMIHMKKEVGEVETKWGMIQVDEDSESSDTSMASSSCLSTDSEVGEESSSSSENGPLFHLTDLMNQLPMRRGLSKHYKGKSQSFTTLAHVKNLEDLAKKVSPYATTIVSSYDRRRMKSCKSYAVFAEATITFK